MDAMSARTIRDAGTPDTAWLPWLAERGFPTASMTDLCPGQSRLVVIAPHPDDEILACGGLLAMRAQRGLACLVVAVTDGEASHAMGSPLTLARLGARRVEESLAGLRALGVPSTFVARLGMPDGGTALLIDKIAQKLGALLKPTDVVISTWRLDGHPDHEAVGEAATRASAASGCRLLQAPVWMWHWAKPEDARVPWEALAALNLTRDAIQAKQKALRCHLSQLEERTGGLGPVLIASIVARVGRSQEHFFH